MSDGTDPLRETDDTIGIRVVCSFSEASAKLRHAGLLPFRVIRATTEHLLLEPAPMRGDDTVDLRLWSSPIRSDTWRGAMGAPQLSAGGGCVFVRAPGALAEADRRHVRKAALCGVARTPIGSRRVGRALFVLDGVEVSDPFASPSHDIGPENLRLALGDQTVETLGSLHVAIVGLGKTGSLAAHSLVRMGVRHLTLIDRDRVESHNVLPADLFEPGSVGRPKSHALADGLLRIAPRTHIVPVHEDIGALPALVRLDAADVVVCCADTTRAREITAAAAWRAGQPLLDIGLLVAAASTDERESLVDVRWLMPTSSCPWCTGGFATIPTAAASVHPSRRSLAQLGVHLGLRELELWCQGRRLRSTWSRVVEGSDGPIRVGEIEATPAFGCTLCRVWHPAVTRPNQRSELPL